jgi:outer membrane lipoprotein-sorting protein
MVRIEGGRGDAGTRNARWWRRLTLALGLTLAMLAPLGIACADTPPQPAQLTAQDQADLLRIAAYLNSISTMTARFHQYSANGGTVSGWLWMERPGRMRFQYDPPSPILLLADRFYVYYVDTQLAEVSQVGLKSTPAWFLLRSPISFSDLVVTRFERGDNSLQITVVDPAAPDNGSLTMVFTGQPLSLRQWTIVDQQRHVTTVSLSQQQFGMALDPNLFVYQNPYTSRRTNDN